MPSSHTSFSSRVSYSIPDSEFEDDHVFTPSHLSPPSDIVIVSSDGFRFRLHRSVLSVNTEFFFTTHNNAVHVDATACPEEITLYDTQIERRKVLNLVFPFMYNIPAPVLDDVPTSLLIDVYKLSNKYGNARAISAASSALHSRNAYCNPEDGFKTYVAANKFKDEKLADAFKKKASGYFGAVASPGSHFADLGQERFDDLFITWRETQFEHASQLATDNSGLRREIVDLTVKVRNLQIAANAFMDRLPAGTQGAGLQKKWNRLRELSSAAV